jgi:hypothetical protein
VLRLHTPRSLQSLSIAGALLGAALLATACAGDLEQPERFDAIVKRFRDGGTGSGGLLRDSGMGSGAVDSGVSGDEPPACVTQLFSKTCGAAGCHEKGSKTLDLASAGVTSRVLDQESDTMLCSGRKYIDSNGGVSLLFDKLGQSPPCGARMPLVGTLSAAQRTCLTDWVDSLGGATQ